MTLHLDVDGAAVPFVPGQTVAAALVADGRLAWRRTRSTGMPRGVFCGIGVCFDCLLLDSLPTDAHDVPMTAVCTESALITRPSD